MSFGVGERLGFGSGLLLTVTVYQGAIESHLPVCGELIWMEYWCVPVFTCHAMVWCYGLPARACA